MLSKEDELDLLSEEEDINRIKDDSTFLSPEQSTNNKLSMTQKVELNDRQSI